MKTFYVTTHATVERIYTVKASSEEEAKQKAKSGIHDGIEESDQDEEVQSVEEDEE